MRLPLLILVLAALRPLMPLSSLEAQAPGPGACEPLGIHAAPMFMDSLRLAELAGLLEPEPLAYVRPSTRRAACTSGPPTGFRARLLPAGTMAQLNTDYPRRDLDGLRWAGRGLSTDVTAGAAVAWGPLSAAFAPVFAWHENQDFEILEVTRPGSSPFAWYWRPTGIDWPQRHGDAAFSWWHPGASHVRLDGFGLAAGVSTETLRWGPARRNPLLMSGAAPGFPHVFLGTGRPVGIGIGRLSLEAIWGRLDDSDFWEGDEDLSRRLLSGLMVMFQPRGLDGLTLGFARSELRYIPPEGLSAWDFFTIAYQDPFTNTPRSEGPWEWENQLVSVFARWALPESGFEAYAEYGRNDFWDEWDDFFKELDHSSAILFGLQKLTPMRRGGHLRVAGEVASLNFSETQRSGRHEQLWYSHSQVRQGYTHRGQLLGAPIGPGSDGQYLEVDLIQPGWTAGMYLQRIRFNKDIYYQALAHRYTYKGHDVELTGGLRGALAVPVAGVRLVADLGWSGRWNRDFVGMLGPYNTTWTQNLTARLGASWIPASGRSVRAGGPVSPPTRP